MKIPSKKIRNRYRERLRYINMSKVLKHLISAGFGAVTYSVNNIGT